MNVDGAPARLTPLNARTLVCLVTAGRRVVSPGELYRDVWRVPGARVERRERTLVQRQISELRKVLGAASDPASVIQTERYGPVTYRLALDPAAIDLWRFEDLTKQAETADPAALVELADQALALFPAPAIAQLDEELFLPAARRRLLGLRATVQDRQLAALTSLQRPESAATLAATILDERPNSRLATETLGSLERAPVREHLYRHTFAAAPATAIVLAVGDLFAFPQADLVVGFSDTFDTTTHDDRVISASSTQGQLLARLYPVRGQLDRELKRALSDAPVASRETRQSKPHGKLCRYPIGTVATIRNGGRSIFCVAYSRLGNNLVARSNVDHLAASLDRLWDAIHHKGGYGEVVMPLVGSGRSRIRELDQNGLLELITKSFHRALTQGIPICRELRIVLTTAQCTHIDLDRFRKLLASLQFAAGPCR